MIKSSPKCWNLFDDQRLARFFSELGLQYKAKMMKLKFAIFASKRSITKTFIQERLVPSGGTLSPMPDFLKQFAWWSWWLISVSGLVHPSGLPLPKTHWKNGGDIPPSYSRGTDHRRVTWDGGNELADLDDPSQHWLTIWPAQNRTWNPCGWRYDDNIHQEIFIFQTWGIHHRALPWQNSLPG
jgi:hypothetical protein